VTVDPGEIVVLPYSSGTTGLPKGVMLTHRNLVANILQLDAVNHFEHDRDTTVAFLPFFHIYGMVVTAMSGLWSGATIVVMPRFDLDTYLDHVRSVEPDDVQRVARQYLTEQTRTVGSYDPLPGASS